MNLLNSGGRLMEELGNKIPALHFTFKVMPSPEPCITTRIRRLPDPS